jgi:hypothetical protein
MIRQQRLGVGITGDENGQIAEIAGSAVPCWSTTNAKRWLRVMPELSPPTEKPTASGPAF